MKNIFLRKIGNVNDINDNAENLFLYCLSGTLMVFVYIPAVFCLVTGASLQALSLAILFGVLLGAIVGTIIGAVVYVRYREHQLKILH